MPFKKPTKPFRTTFTSKFSNLHDIYQGNTNHWSIMRVQSDRYVVQERQKEREKKGQLVQTLPPYPGCTTAPYVWSREEADKLRGQESFYDLVLQGLGGNLPGDHSKGSHKNYNKSVIHWPPNCYSEGAKEKVKYYEFTDVTLKLSQRPKLDRNKLPA